MLGGYGLQHALRCTIIGCVADVPLAPNTPNDELISRMLDRCKFIELREMLYDHSDVHPECIAAIHALNDYIALTDGYWATFGKCLH